MEQVMICVICGERNIHAGEFKYMPSEMSPGQNFPIHSLLPDNMSIISFDIIPTPCEYQETHPYRAMNIVKINTDLDSKQYKENLIITPLARISIDWIEIIVCNAYYALHPIFYALHRREKERWSIPGLSRKGLIMMRVLMEKGFSNLTQG